MGEGSLYAIIVVLVLIITVVGKLPSNKMLDKMDANSRQRQYDKRMQNSNPPKVENLADRYKK